MCTGPTYRVSVSGYSWHPAEGQSTFWRVCKLHSAQTCEKCTSSWHMDWRYVRIINKTMQVHEIAWACVTVQKSCCPEIVRFLSFNDICWQMKWLVANITNLLRMGRQLRQTEREHTVWLAGSIRRNCATLWWTGIIVLTPTYLPPYLYTLVNTIRLQYTLTVK